MSVPSVGLVFDDRYLAHDTGLSLIADRSPFSLTYLAVPTRAEFVIGSDVWELSAIMRALGCPSSHPFFPTHYRDAVSQTDLLIQPAIPIWSYVPGLPAFERLIVEGELATKRALELI